MEGQVLLGDALELMKLLPDNSVDCIITDPPYGTIAASWDKIVDFNLMWKEFNRITRPGGGDDSICISTIHH